MDKSSQSTEFILLMKKNHYNMTILKHNNDNNNNSTTIVSQTHILQNNAFSIMLSNDNTIDDRAKELKSII